MCSTRWSGKPGTRWRRLPLRCGSVRDGRGGRCTVVSTNPDNIRMSDTRRRMVLLGALALCLVAAGLGRAEAMPQIVTLPAYDVGPPPAAGVLPNAASFSAPLPPGRIGVAPGPANVRYTFDGGVHRPITDTNGGHELRPIGQN